MKWAYSKVLSHIKDGQMSVTLEAVRWILFLIQSHVYSLVRDGALIIQQTCQSLQEQQEQHTHPLSLGDLSYELSAWTEMNFHSHFYPPNQLWGCRMSSSLGLSTVETMDLWRKTINQANETQRMMLKVPSLIVLMRFSEIWWSRVIWNRTLQWTVFKGLASEALGDKDLNWVPRLKTKT